MMLFERVPSQPCSYTARDIRGAGPTNPNPNCLGNVRTKIAVFPEMILVKQKKLEVGIG